MISPPAPFIGTNAFHWNPTDKVSKIRLVRAYIAAGWIWTPAGLYVQPMKQAQKQYLGLDDYFAAMQAAGVEVLACVNQTPNWLNGYTHWDTSNDWPPVPPGANREDPASYEQYAEFWFQFCARYGRKKHPDSVLRVDPAPPRWTGDGVQVKKSGLGLVKMVEIGNEWLKWWKMWSETEKGQMVTAREQAAMLVAVRRAIRRADPSMKVLHGATTNYEMPFLQELVSHCEALGEPNPFDAFSIHHYSSLGNRLGVHPPNWPVNQACAPEEDPDFPSIAAIVAFAKVLRKPVYVTEAGFDTMPDSPNTPHVVAGQDRRRSQADWNLRTILEYVRLGVKRVYLFNFSDDHNPVGQFNSCGLVLGEPAGYSPKQSYFTITEAAARLHGYRYWRTFDVEGARAMVFQNLTGAAVVAYWLPSATGARKWVQMFGRLTEATETVRFMDLPKAQAPGKAQAASKAKTA